MTKATLTNCVLNVADFEQTKRKVLNWIQSFNTFCFLDNHQYQLPPHSEECLAAAGVQREIRVSTGKALENFQKFLDEKRSWLFGHFSYDLKNEIEELQSHHADKIGFPDLYFFEPAVLVRLSKDQLMIESVHPEKIADEIMGTAVEIKKGAYLPPLIQSRISRDEYLRLIGQLQAHILRGDCYEINFCQEFFANDAVIDPESVFNKLSKISPNPFSALYRVDDQWLICASPERFLRKKGNTILSQPMKGTAPRVAGDPVKDNIQKENLQESQKDRSENVMVVDLVRNDLARICQEGSVKVDELYGIYSFPQVHQMVSTVSGVVKSGLKISEMIRACFPMGSMTGAPKKRVMELIEEYEKTRRGIFSGALGYIDPDSDFDFNVVIRSLMYNQSSHYLSFQAGSGITFYSDAEKEWEECLLKAAAIRRSLKD